MATVSVGTNITREFGLMKGKWIAHRRKITAKSKADLMRKVRAWKKDLGILKKDTSHTLVVVGRGAFPEWIKVDSKEKIEI